MNSVKITFKSHPRWLRFVRTLVREVCRVAGFSGARTGHLVLAVDEACTNIIKHSYRGNSDGLIVLECKLKGKGVEFILKDKGAKVIPRKIRHRSLDEVRPGGLGVFFIKRMMDKVVYGRSKGMNILRMVKYVKKG